MLLTPDWVSLHHRMTKKYELAAIRQFEKDQDKAKVDFLSVITEIINNEPQYRDSESVHDFVNHSYQEFLRFDFRNKIVGELQRRNPQLSHNNANRFYDLIRKKFLGEEHRFAKFLIYIISKIIDQRKMSINGTWYLIQAIQGKIPKENIIKRFFHSLKVITRYDIAKD